MEDEAKQLNQIRLNEEMELKRKSDEIEKVRQEELAKEARQLELERTKLSNTNFIKVFDLYKEAIGFINKSFNDEHKSLEDFKEVKNLTLKNIEDMTQQLYTNYDVESKNIINFFSSSQKLLEDDKNNNILIINSSNANDFKKCKDIYNITQAFILKKYELVKNEKESLNTCIIQKNKQLTNKKMRLIQCKQDIITKLKFMESIPTLLPDVLKIFNNNILEESIIIDDNLAKAITSYKANITDIFDKNLLKLTQHANFLNSQKTNIESQLISLQKYLNNCINMIQQNSSYIKDLNIKPDLDLLLKKYNLDIIDKINKYISLEFSKREDLFSGLITPLSNQLAAINIQDVLSQYPNEVQTMETNLTSKLLSSQKDINIAESKYRSEMGSINLVEIEKIKKTFELTTKYKNLIKILNINKLNFEKKNLEEKRDKVLTIENKINNYNGYVSSFKKQIENYNSQHEIILKEYNAKMQNIQIICKSLIDQKFTENMENSCYKLQDYNKQLTIIQRSYDSNVDQIINNLAVINQDIDNFSKIYGTYDILNLKINEIDAKIKNINENYNRELTQLTQEYTIQLTVEQERLEQIEKQNKTNEFIKEKMSAIKLNLEIRKTEKKINFLDEQDELLKKSEEKQKINQIKFNKDRQEFEKKFNKDRQEFDRLFIEYTKFLENLNTQLTEEEKWEAEEFEIKGKLTVNKFQQLKAMNDLTEVMNTSSLSENQKKTLDNTISALNKFKEEEKTILIMYNEFLNKKEEFKKRKIAQENAQNILKKKILADENKINKEIQEINKEIQSTQDNIQTLKDAKVEALKVLIDNCLQNITVNPDDTNLNDLKKLEDTFNDVIQIQTTENKIMDNSLELIDSQRLTILKSLEDEKKKLTEIRDKIILQNKQKLEQDLKNLEKSTQQFAADQKLEQDLEKARQSIKQFDDKQEIEELKTNKDRLMTELLKNKNDKDVVDLEFKLYKENLINNYQSNIENLSKNTTQSNKTLNEYAQYYKLLIPLIESKVSDLTKIQEANNKKLEIMEVMTTSIDPNPINPLDDLSEQNNSLDDLSEQNNSLMVQPNIP